MRASVPTRKLNVFPLFNGLFIFTVSKLNFPMFTFLDHKIIQRNAAPIITKKEIFAKVLLNKFIKIKSSNYF